MHGNSTLTHISQVLKCWQQTQGRPSKKKNGLRGIVGIQKPTKIPRTENSLTSIKLILPLLPTTTSRIVLNSRQRTNEINLFYHAFHESPIPLFIVRKPYNVDLRGLRQMKKGFLHKSIKSFQVQQEIQNKSWNRIIFESLLKMKI